MSGLESGKRCTVPRWTKKILQAASTSGGPCEGALNLVGMDMHAQDGSVFAHAHWDLDTAEQVVAQLTEAIAEARRRGAN